uniref:Uncharacterized protein n=1 Tax=Anguilla anguilla TaxID=7936 RepID=A0A0E9SZR5_ANGAN
MMTKVETNESLLIW